MLSIVLFTFFGKYSNIKNEQQVTKVIKQTAETVLSPRYKFFQVAPVYLIKYFPNLSVSAARIASCHLLAAELAVLGLVFRAFVLR